MTGWDLCLGGGVSRGNIRAFGVLCGVLGLGRVSNEGPA